MSIEESTTRSVVAVECVVTNDRAVRFGCLLDHSLDASGVKVHEIAGTKDTGVAHSLANVDLAVSKDVVTHTLPCTVRSHVALLHGVQVLCWRSIRRSDRPASQ